MSTIGEQGVTSAKLSSIVGMPVPGNRRCNFFCNSMTHGFPDGRGGTTGIEVRASGDEDVEIRFSDDGCGMSADVRHKAFDPFFTTRRDQGCTGLGLHTVHTIVTNCLGGQVSLDSEPDEGTIIRITLPRVVPASAAP